MSCHSIIFSTYLVKILQENGFEAHSRQLLSQELALHRLVLVLADLVGVLQVDLLDKLTNQVLVEVGAEFLRKLPQSNSKLL